MGATRRNFAKDFKLAAVQRVTDRGEPRHEVALELGIRPDQLLQWVTSSTRAGRVTAPAPGGPDPELTRLSLENQVLRAECDRLQKALKFLVVNGKS